MKQDTRHRTPPRNSTHPNRHAPHGKAARRRARRRQRLLPLAVTLIVCAIALAIVVIRLPRGQNAVPAVHTMERAPGQDAAPPYP